MGLILIVDENASSRQLMETIVQRDHHQSVTASSAAEGIERATQQVPSLILAADRMSRVSGGEMCRRLKAMPELSHVPILLFGADEYLRDPAYARGFQADGSFMLPVLPADLLNLIRKFVKS